MYRYKDQQGRTQQLADEHELSEAITDGRVQAATPFAQDEERWTTAARHPAYQQLTAVGAAAAQAAAPASSTGWQRYGFVVLGLLVMGAVVYGKADRRMQERDRMMETVVAFNEGQEIPPAVLAKPPEGRAAKQIWVFVTGMHDLQQAIVDVQRTYGVERAPDVWLSPTYVRRASAHPQVAAYFDSLERFYSTYDDSLPALMRRVLTARAQTANLRTSDLARLLRSVEGAADPYEQVARTGSRWAREASRVHDILVAAEASGVVMRNDEVVFTQPGRQVMFDAAVDRMLSLEAELEALQRAAAQKAAEDLARASQR